MCLTVTVNNTADHALDLINKLYEMRMEERHCDFVIKVGSETILAHRNVLSAMSDYFDRMLFHDTIENSSGMVDMKNVDPDCVRICVNFIYGREVKVFEDKYEDLMHVANLMQLNKLGKIVENIIGQNLSVISFFAAKRIADMYGSEILQEKCKEFANQNLSMISMGDEFTDLDKNFITAAIKSGNVKMTEEKKLDAVLRWVKHDVESRSEDLAHLLDSIRLGYVPIEKRQQLVHQSYLKDNVSAVRNLCSSIVNSLKNKIEKGKEKAVVIFDNKSGHLQQFRPRFNKWRRMHRLNDNMIEEFVAEYYGDLCAIVCGDKIYVFAQGDIDKVFSLKYDDEAATWEELVINEENRGEFPAVVTQGRLFYEMDAVVDWATKCVKGCDPEALSWSELQDKFENSLTSTLLVLRGYIYFFGGTDESGDCINNVQRFDPITSEWKEMKPMREAKSGAAAVELDNKAYVVGGCVGYNVATLDCYDPEMDQWTSLAPMAIPRSLFKVFAIDGCIYAVGGEAPSLYSLPKSIEKYDLKKNEWTMVQLPRRTSLGILDSVEIQLD